MKRNIAKTPHYWKKAAKELSNRDEIMAGIIQNYPGEILTRTHDCAFTCLSRSIIGQQISVKAADSIAARAEALVKPWQPKILLATKEEDLRACGLSGQKINYLRAIADVMKEKGWSDKDFAELSDEEVITKLTQLKGIGNWTAHMFMIFYLHRPDVLPLQDIGLQKAMKRHYKITDKGFERRARKLAKEWAPWNTVATWYLWRSLDPIPVSY